MQYGQFNVDYELRPYNPERMRKERWAKLQAALKKWGLGAMLLYDYDFHRYAGYYSFHQYARRRPGTYCLVVAGEEVPYVNYDKYPGNWEELRMPWFKDHFLFHSSRPYQLMNGLPDHPEAMRENYKMNVREILPVLQKHGVADMPVGCDIISPLMIDVLREGGIKIVDGTIAMVDAITQKTEDELFCLKMAGVITDAAHWECATSMRPGMTELEIAGIAANACYKYGGEEMEGPSFVVVSGERTGYGIPHMPSDRRVRPGDFVALDINGVSFQGYRTCHYRTYVVGDKPTQFQKEIYGLVADAQSALESTLKVGVTTAEAQKEYEKLGDFPGGWGREPEFPAPGRYFLGSGGHPIGLRSGDPGYSVPGSGKLFGDFPGGMIKENYTFSAEVACFTWDGKRWAKDGVKLENSGVVTAEKGYESFYRTQTKDLIAVGLPGEYFTPIPSAYSAK